LSAVIVVDNDEAADLNLMVEATGSAQRHRLYCQLVATSGAAALRVMRSELPLLRRICGPAAARRGSASGGPGGGGDALRREWLQALGRSAAAAGARSGDCGLAVFSCTGRGASMHGHQAAEARLIDEVLLQRVPFAGLYVNGELGPITKGGYCGWAASGVVVQEGGLSLQAGRRAEAMPMPSVLQGFTTILGMIG
jgi:hypothetical protein